MARIIKRGGDKLTEMNLNCRHCDSTVAFCVEDWIEPSGMGNICGALRCPACSKLIEFSFDALPASWQKHIATLESGDDPNRGR